MEDLEVDERERLEVLEDLGVDERERLEVLEDLGVDERERLEVLEDLRADESQRSGVFEDLAGARWRLAGIVVAGCALLAMSGCKRPAEDARDPRALGDSSAPAGAAAPVPVAPADTPPATAPDRVPGSAPGDTIARDAAPAPAPGPVPDYGPVSTALSAPPPALARQVALVPVASGLRRPVGLVPAPGDASGRLFAVEQHVGRVRTLRPDGNRYKIDPVPFIDLKGRVSRGNEQGLLALAFHPRFAENGRVYINYTDPRGDTRVVEYRLDAAHPDRVDMSTAREIFRLEQPFSNHNGGNLAFGPDGKLYVGTGDGGSAGDPHGAGQDPNNLLAKMLRFDVDAPAPTPELVHMGLRNPWRYHFDSATGDLYIADVGQSQYEFVYVLAADDIDGHNFGWNVVEGNHCFRSRNCDISRFTPAVIEYDHSQGCSITGGLVYRGKALPALAGVYFYADFCTGIIRSFRWVRDGVRQHWAWDPVLTPGGSIERLSAFGSDAAGELYILSLNGNVYKLVPR